MKNLWIYTALIVFALSSCEFDDTVPLKGNPAVSDSTALMSQRDIFVSFVVNEDEEDEFSVYRIHGNKFVSEAEHFRPGLCEYDAYFDTTRSYAEVERMMFHDTTKEEEEFEIEIIECIDQIYTESEKDSILLFTGHRPYLNLRDSTSGAQVRYVDEEGELWTSRTAQRTNDDRFTISSVIENDINNDYKYIVFGEFSCLLKAMGPSRGETMKITRGRFKMFAQKL